MEKKEKIPFEFKNEVRDGKTKIVMSGTIREAMDSSDNRIINAKVLKDALDGASGDVIISLNSRGGDVFQGIEMYNLIKSYPGKVTVRVTALAASAASVFAMGADKVIMCKGSMMMIHEATSVAWGNKQVFKKEIEALEKIDGRLIDVYEQKTGIDRGEIERMIAEETWLDAKEAVEKGFADEYELEEDEIQKNQSDVTFAMSEKEVVVIVREEFEKRKEEAKEDTKRKSFLNNVSEMLRK